MHKGRLASVALEAVLDCAGIGGWAFDVATQTLTWTALTSAIHEVSGDAPLDLESALSFYPSDVVPLLRQTVRDGIEHGTPWDLELPFITAKGRNLWVRATGRAVLQHGRVIRLLGAFQDITPRHVAAQEMARLALVVRQMTNAVVITDADGVTEWVNEAFCRLTGFSSAQLLGRRPGDLLQGSDTDPATVELMRAAIRHGRGFDVEVMNYTRAGEPYWIAAICTPLLDARSQITGFIAVQSDVTARRRAEAATNGEIAHRMATENLLRDVLDALPDGVMAFDPQERLVLVNSAHRRLFPIMSPAMQPGQDLQQVIGYGLAHGQYVDVGETEAERQSWLAEYIAALRAPGPARTLRLPQGGFVQARERRSASGNLVCVRTDITLLTHAEAVIRRQAERDSLTDLVNRNVIIERLNDELRAGRGADRPTGALVLLDVDHFKTINDTLGHDFGDVVLVEIAKRLQACVRKTDTVARLGGDEFAILLPSLGSAQEAGHACAILLTRLHDIVAQPVLLAERRTSPSVSMGMALYPGDGDAAQVLLNSADLALYEAKRRGRGRWCQFDREQASLRSRRQRVAADLREAVADDLLTVDLQPKLRIAEARHAGFEALARWTHHGQVIHPAEFIPISEETGLIVPLGRCILRRSLKALASMQARGLRPGTVAVNIGALQLASDHFVDEVAQALATHDIAASQLEIEITETVLLDRSADRIERSMRELRELGVRLSLDDFGTGYASLAHLQRFPVQRLKIDRSFIRDFSGRPEDGVIVRTIISLAHGLGMDVVGEGVETRMQLDYLREQGCDEAQGYFIARPLSLAKAADYLVAMDPPAAAGATQAIAVSSAR